MVTSRIDPEKITTYELSVSHVDENGNKDDGSGSVGSMSKDFARNSPPSAFDGKGDSTVDSNLVNSSGFDEQLSPANETADGVDEGKGSADLKEDSKRSPSSRIPKFIGFEYNLRTESPPPGNQIHTL